MAMDEKLNGLFQTQWRWIIAAYLFLAGVGGGAYLTGVITSYMPGFATLSQIGVFLGFPCVALGCAFLLLDLGKITNFWRAAMKPGNSWMARGTIIISIFMIIGFFHIILGVFGGAEVAEGAAWADSLSNGVKTLGIIGAIFAVATMIYTGLLLGDAIPVAFWSTAMLPVLFLVSACSTGIMAIVLVGSLAGDGVKDGLAFLERVDVWVMAVEAFVLFVFIYGSYRTPASRKSTSVVICGKGTMQFWIGVVVCGLIIPGIINVAGLHNIAFLGAISGLIGGLLLRHVILLGGLKPEFEVGQFQFKPIFREKMAMPAMGKLPPS